MSKTSEEKVTMFAETKYTTSWMYDIIKDICGGAR